MLNAIVHFKEGKKCDMVFHINFNSIEHIVINTKNNNILLCNAVYRTAVNRISS